jgi:hypothetical protein
MNPSEAEADSSWDAGRAWRMFEELTTTMLGSRALAKACVDHFDYALKLRTGEVIRFTDAEIIRPGWIHLEVREPAAQPRMNRLPFMADRGIDVRIDEIVWVMDAPEGS